MRILYLINFAGKAGTEKYVLELVREFNGKRAECYFAYNIAGQLSEQMESMGIPSKRIEMRSPYDIRAAKELAAYCRENDIDIIHSQYPRENYVAVLSKLFYGKVKLVNTSHLVIKTGSLWKITNKIFTRFDDRIISVCNYGKNVLISNGVIKSKIEVIHNGLPGNVSFPDSTIRQELSVSNDTFVFVTLARYSPEKGIPFLIDCIVELKKISSRKFVLLIAGDGDGFDDAKNQIEKLGLTEDIYQLGFRNDASNVLEGADAFINPSSSEALSFAILEGLSHGLPVIATNVGGTGDIINDKTDCGILVEYGNVRETAIAMKKLMDDKSLYDRYSENAKKNIKENFNSGILYDKLYSVYKKITSSEEKENA